MEILKQLNYRFAHHHLHTEYSPQDAPVQIKKLVKYSKHLGYKTVTVTDHGTVGSWVKFAQACKDEGMRPIFGIEAYFSADRHERGGKRDNNHIVLLAKNNEGIRTIYRLSESSFRDGFYYDPRIDWDLLERFHEGVICSSACVSGIIADLVIQDKMDEAREAALRLKKIFGPDFYMEIQYHCLEVEKKAYAGVAKLAAELGIKVLGTNDVHYLRKEDAFTQEAMFALNTGSCIRDPNRLRHETNQLYLKSPDEMIDMFGGFERQAIQSALEIADSCTAELEFGRTVLPSIDLPKEYKSDFDYLKALARRGLRKREKEGKKEYEDRFEEELGVVSALREKGHMFDRYFLIVYDYVNYAKSKGIQVGAGRGSGAGSLLLYCLGITNVDPLPYDLLFERFLTPDRNEMPDIDVDFAHDRVDEVVQYLYDKYNPEKCARIGTTPTVHAAGAIKAAFRAFDPENSFEEKEKEKAIERQARKAATKKMSTSRGYKKKTFVDRSVMVANEITKLLPKGTNNQPTDKCTLVKQKYEKNPEEMIYAYSIPEIEAYRKKYPEVFRFAEQIEGLVSNRSIHAAGVLISERPLVEVCPQQFAGKDKKMATAYDMGDVDKLGLVKFDILSTQVLTIFAKTMESIRERHAKEVDVDDLSPTDPEIYKMFAKGQTFAIFQFESPGMQRTLQQIKPDCFEDIVAANALFRPGPMAHIEDFAKRKNGARFEYDVPSLETVLKPTFGIMVYQEQVMKVVRILAGFTGSEADKVRKAMGKKKRDLLDSLKAKFLEGVKRLNSCPLQMAEDIWRKMESFGSYAFNKAHAAGYAYTAYQCAWLKKYYPGEYMASQLSVEGGSGHYDTVRQYEGVSSEMGMKIMPACVNKSRPDYKVVDMQGGKIGIRRGFVGIKGLGDESCKSIIEAQPFKNMLDFCLRAPVAAKENIMVLLLDEGAFDCFMPKLSERLCRPATRRDLEDEAATKRLEAARQRNLKGQKKEMQEIKGFFSLDGEEDVI